MKSKHTLKDVLLNTGKSVKSAVIGLGLFGLVSTLNLPKIFADEIASKTKENDWKIEATIDVIPYNLQTQGLEEEIGATGEISDTYLSHVVRFNDPEIIWPNYPMHYDLVEIEVTKDNISDINKINISPSAGTLDIPKTLIKPKISIYTPSDIGFHLQAHQISGNALEKAKVPGRESFEDFNLEENQDNHTLTTESERIYSLGIVNFWDNVFFSDWSEREIYDDGTIKRDIIESFPEKANTEYQCSRNFKTLETSIFTNLPIIKEISFLGGLKFNLFEINDMQKIQQIFHEECNDTKSIPFGEGGVSGITERISDTIIDSELNSSIKAQGLGPMLGLSGSKNICDWLKVYGDFSKSWIRLDTKRNATFSRVSNTIAEETRLSYDDLIDSPTKTLMIETIVNSTSHEEEKAQFEIAKTYNSLQTEMNLGLEFLLGKYVTLSAGFWKNITQGLPTPAKFNYSNFKEDNAVNLWSYDEELKDISHQGFKLGVKISY